MLLLKLLLFLLELLHTELTIAEHADITHARLRPFKLLLSRISSLPLAHVTTYFHWAELAFNHLLGESRSHLSATNRTLALHHIKGFKLLDDSRVLRVDSIHQLEDRIIRNEAILLTIQVNSGTSRVLFTKELFKLLSFFLYWLVSNSSNHTSLFKSSHRFNRGSAGVNCFILHST